MHHTTVQRFAVRDLVPSRTVGTCTEGLQGGCRGRKHHVVAACRSKYKTLLWLPSRSHTTGTDRQPSVSSFLGFSSALFDLPEVIADNAPQPPEASQAASSAGEASPEQQHWERVALRLSLWFWFRAVCSCRCSRRSPAIAIAANPRRCYLGAAPRLLSRGLRRRKLSIRAICRLSCLCYRPTGFQHRSHSSANWLPIGDWLQIDTKNLPSPNLWLVHHRT